MITLENIKETLDSNDKLTDEIRDNLYSLIYIFNNSFPDISLENLNNNLKTLQIIKSNKFINKRVSHYNYATNVLEFNVDKINEGYDVKHVMMHELLNIITNNGKQTGFNYNNKFEALNAGYTEIVSNNLVGNESDISYLQDEIVSTTLMSIMMDNDTFSNAYFNNDAGLLAKKMDEYDGKLLNIVGQLNYRYNNPDAIETKQLTPDKDLTEVLLSKEREKYVIECFGQWIPMSKENIDGKLEAIMKDHNIEVNYTK